MQWREESSKDHSLIKMHLMGCLNLSREFPREQVAVVVLLPVDHHPGIESLRTPLPIN